MSYRCNQHISSVSMKKNNFQFVSDCVEFHYCLVISWRVFADKLASYLQTKDDHSNLLATTINVWMILV